MNLARTTVAILGAAFCLNAQFPDLTPATPLIGAALRGDTVEVKRLLADGANPNEARFLGFAPVFLPIFQQNAEILREMVKKGADIKATDPAGSTTLMWAAYNEAGKTELVNELLRLGVDPNQKNKAGETAMTWALRRGYTPVVDALKNGGATDAEMIKEAVVKAVASLQKSAPQFVKVSGCTSCHHQSLPQMAIGIARERGLPVDEELSKQQIKAVIAMFKPMRELMLQGTEKIPDPAISVSYALVGLAAEGQTSDPTIDAMTHLVSTRQLPDGRFPALSMRPPLESSDFTATALSLRSLQVYGKNSGEQVAKAREWLRTAEPRTNEDRAMRLLGLIWSGAEAEDLQKAARSIVAEQQPDGGWAQLGTLQTDAYATGQALVALRWSGQVAVSDAAYQRGVAYLLRTQLSDGSWLVRSRSFPFQPYKESGFPHGKDQWISASGTSWAAMALGLTAPRVGHEVSGF